MDDKINEDSKSAKLLHAVLTKVKTVLGENSSHYSKFKAITDRLSYEPPEAQPGLWQWLLSTLESVDDSGGLTEEQRSILVPIVNGSNYEGLE